MITPLTPPLTALFDRLSTLNGLLLLLGNQLDNFNTLWRRNFKEQGFEIDHSIAGFTLGISDLTSSPAPRVRGWYPVGSYIARGEEYLNASSTLISRETAWTVGQAYEAFETFLKDFSAHVYAAHPDLAKVARAKIRFSGEPDLSVIKDAVRRLRWSTAEFTSALARISPSLADAELNNNRGINIRDWHSAFAEVRHAATHSNFVIKSLRLAGMSAEARIVLQNKFSGSTSNEGYVLELTLEQAKSALELAGEYAFLIFKCLSIQHEYRWDILAMKENQGA